MTNDIERRLAALEQVQLTRRGLRIVYTCDSTPHTFAEFPKGAPYQHLHPSPAGMWHESATLHTQSDINAMASEGWQIVKVNYTRKWRDSGAEATA